MMKKYTLVKDRELPQKEEIEKGKDFGHIKANYDKLTSPLYRKPLYKDPKTFLALLLILLVLWLVMMSDEEKANENKSNKTEQAEGK